MAFLARAGLRRSSTLRVDDIFKSIIQAQAVYDVADETPFQLSPLLTAKLRNNIFLKREDMQPVFSFKLRGAYNKISNLAKEQQARGIAACSAGNHAQGVAMSAARIGIQAVIVMPTTTPKIKVEAVRKWSCRLILHGDTYSEAYARTLELCEEEGLTLVHPFDDPLVIAGQGTIGMEILKQFRSSNNGNVDAELDYVFCCVGGGGLVSGVVT